MLVHIKELDVSPLHDDWDYENAKTIAARTIKTYDKFIRFVHEIKKHKIDLIVGENWYTVEDYAFSFPDDSDMVPILYVYVVSY